MFLCTSSRIVGPHIDAENTERTTKFQALKNETPEIAFRGPT
jgi:hypothetical protein